MRRSGKPDLFPFLVGVAASDYLLRTLRPKEVDLGGRDPWFFLCGLSAQRWVGDELWGLFLVGDGEEREITEAHDSGHLGEVDLVYCVGDVVVVGVEAGEEPERGNVVQDEGELIGAEEDAESGVAFEAVVEGEADVLVFSLDGVKEVGRVECADEIETVCGVGGYFDHAVGLRAWLLVATD